MSAPLSLRFLPRICDLRSRFSALSSWMSSKLERVIWLRVLVTLANMKGRMDVRTDVRTYVRTDVHDVMAIKPNFLTSMGYHIFLTMVLRARALAHVNFKWSIWERKIVKLTCVSCKHTFSSSENLHKHYKTFTDHCPKGHPL